MWSKVLSTVSLDLQVLRRSSRWRPTSFPTPVSGLGDGDRDYTYGGCTIVRYIQSINFFLKCLLLYSNFCQPCHFFLTGPSVFQDVDGGPVWTYESRHFTSTILSNWVNLNLPSVLYHILTYWQSFLIYTLSLETYSSKYVEFFITKYFFRSTSYHLCHTVVNIIKFCLWLIMDNNDLLIVTRNPVLPELLLYIWKKKKKNFFVNSVYDCY